MKAFQNRARGKRGAAVGVLAASMLASVLGMAPTAHAADVAVGCNANDLRDAIIAANGNAADDSISLRKGCTYTYDSGVFGTDAALVVDLNDGDLTIWGNGATIKIRNDDSNIRHFDVLGAGTFRLNSLTLKGGHVQTSATLQGDTVAGSINAPDADVVGEKLTVTDNEVVGVGVGTTVTAGGGIVAGTLSLTRSTISNNDVKGYGLAAVSAAGGAIADAVFMDRSVVKGNDVSGTGLAISVGLGGGIVTDDFTNDEGSSITGNTVSANAGLLAVSAGGGLVTTGAVEAADLTVSGNKASSSGAVALTAGGGWAVLGGAFDDSDDGVSITKNKAKCSSSACASLGGGAVLQGAGGEVFNWTVSGNTAEAKQGLAAGGGIAVLGGDYLFTDFTVVKNSAKGAFQVGGGLAAFDPGTIDIDTSDIEHNKPDNCFNVLGCQ